MERSYDKDAPDFVGSYFLNSFKLFEQIKGIGVPPSNTAVLAVDTARPRRRNPDIAGLCVETITHTLLEPRLFL